MRRPLNLIPGARLLRHEMTPAARQLWAALRRHQLAGLHVWSQNPIGPFVVDFAYAVRRLAIEVDGRRMRNKPRQTPRERRSWSSTGGAL